MHCAPWMRKRWGPAVLIPVLLGSCKGRSSSERTVWPEPDLPDLERAEISPAVIQLHAPGDRQLEAVGFRSDGAQFDLSEYPDRFSCSWSGQGPPSGTDQNPSGVLVTLMEPARCKTTLYVSSDAAVQENMEIPVHLTVQGPGESSQEADAVLVVGADDYSFASVPSQTDWVVLNSASDSTIVLLTACEQQDNSPPSTVDWLLYSGSGTNGHGFVELKENLTLSGCSRSPEVDVFSSDQGVWILPESALDEKGIEDLWTDQENDELDLPELGYQDRDVLDVFVYEYEGAGVEGLQELAHANKLFEENLVGIEFNPVDAEEKEGCVLDALFPQNPCRTEFLKTCIGPEETLSAVSPPLELRLYVIFYSGKDPGSGGSWRGKTCKPADTEGAQVVFLPTERSAPETLAHEFGHVLGHRHPSLSWESGHVHEYLRGFQDDPERTKKNLMYDQGTGRNLLTVGQAFRMIVDLGSWYQIDPGLGCAGRQPGRACTDDPYEGVLCPQIHWAEGTAPVLSDGTGEHGSGAGNGGG